MSNLGRNNLWFGLNVETRSDGTLVEQTASIRLNSLGTDKRGRISIGWDCKSSQELQGLVTEMKAELDELLNCGAGAFRRADEK